MQIKVQCPAKINLTLKVLSKREDGFHNIDSIMQTIGLYDYLTITVEDADVFAIELSGTSTEIPYNEKNIVYKACNLFVENVHIKPCKIHVYIEKNIPVAAGLAGGSTDAAGVLWGLSKLFNDVLSREKLHSICAQLGSDLNLCLEGGCQKTSGRGEKLEAMLFKEFNVSLIKPVALGISAKEAYTKFSAKNLAGMTGREKYVNDLEWAIVDDYTELQTIKKMYPKAVMSGSGSTYYGIDMNFDEEEGFWVKNDIPAVNWGVREVSFY